MCEHLEELDKALKEKQIKETFRGQPWSNNCREWVYYDCFLDVERLRERFALPAFVVAYSNDDPRSGLEAGLVCDLCKDAVVGAHPSVAAGKVCFT